MKEMKNNINLNKILPELIKVYVAMGLSNNIFFESIKKWITNYIISDNETMKELKKISEEKISILSFFKYLNQNCYIILKAIEKFNQIKELGEISNASVTLNESSLFKRLIPNCESILNVKLNFILSKDKLNAKKDSGDSLLKLGKDIINILNQNKENLKDSDIKFDGNYLVHVYFNEEKEIFCETCSDNDLEDFIIMKYLLLNKFI